MQSPAFPLDENKRLELLQSLHLLDTPAEERFDRITRIACRLFGVDGATISLIDSSREWFKSTCGLELPPQVARTVSLSAHGVAEDAPMVVEEAALDARFFDNPLVTGDIGVRFFASAPITMGEGSAPAALSLWDRKGRAAASLDVAALLDLAAIAARELAVSDRSSAQIDTQLTTSLESRIDGLTRLWNRAAVVDILQRELTYSQRNGTFVGVLVVDIDGLKRINDRLGHEVGDSTLCEVARRLRATVRPYDSIGRYGGEEFLVLLPGADHNSSYTAAERVRLSVAEGNSIGFATPVTISVGGSSINGQTASDSSALIRKAEGALQQAKARGGNRVQVS